MRRLAALVAVVVLVGVVGCSDPEGIARVHFDLVAPRVVDFGAASPPPVDPFALSHASGSLEATPASNHLFVGVEGLPPVPPSSLVAYRLWVSTQPSGGSWSAVTEVEPLASGEAALHLAQVSVPVPLAAIRSAIVSIDARGALAPSSAIVLSGATDASAGPGAAPTDAGGGGHVH